MSGHRPLARIALGDAVLADVAGQRDDARDVAAANVQPGMALSLDLRADRGVDDAIGILQGSETRRRDVANELRGLIATKHGGGPEIVGILAGEIVRSSK